MSAMYVQRTDSTRMLIPLGRPVLAVMLLENGYPSRFRDGPVLSRVNVVRQPRLGAAASERMSFRVRASTQVREGQELIVSVFVCLDCERR
jgi:hypothetical protein